MTDFLTAALALWPWFAFAAVTCAVLVWAEYPAVNRRTHRPSRPDIDALVESALCDGYDDAQMAGFCEAEKKRNHLAPLSNAEVNRRLGVAMDDACRDFRAELDRWSA